MKIFSFFKRKRAPPEPLPKPPPERQLPAVPNYSYWQYREDLFNPSFTLDHIMSMAGWQIPRPPRYPEEGEVWEFRQCRKHGTDGLYPIDLKFDSSRNYWPFLFCGCLYFVHDNKAVFEVKKKLEEGWKKVEKKAGEMLH